MGVMAGGLMAVALMQAAAPEAKQATIIAGPTWLSRPTGEDLDRVFPPGASRDNRSGATVMKCVVEADGRMGDCRVLAEQPEGFGFGAATLKLAPRFRIDPKSAPKGAQGATIVLPIRFIVPGSAEAVRIKLQPGEAAALVTVINGSGPPGGVRVPCASGANPDRQCQLHPFDWLAMPDPARSEAVVSNSDQRDGMALMECKVSEVGGLSACKVGGASPRNEAALLELSKAFRAPQRTPDGTSTAGQRAVLRFDWKLLAELRGQTPGKPAAVAAPASAAGGR